MNRKALVLSMATILLALCASCNYAIHTRGVRAALVRAEAPWRPTPTPPAPYSTASIFNFQTKDVADYAWLRTQVDYKCDVPIRSDSLARLATDYYGTPRHPDYHAAMAWYTLGCTYLDMHEDLRGIDVFLQAKPLFPDTLNRYYSLGLQNLGRLFTAHNRYPEAEENLRAFKRLCAERQDSALMAHTDYLLGKTLMWASRYDEADDCFDAVSSNRYTTARYRHRVLFQKAKIYLHHRHDYDSALRLVNSYLSETTDDPSSGLSVKGDIFRALGKSDSAYACYSAAASPKAEIKTRCNVYRNLAELSSELKKDDVPLSFYTAQYATLLDSIFQQARHEEIDALIRRQDARLQAAENAQGC